ncbi:putative MFS family arabinose efflux permease [Aminobacter aminovorans]|uniref:MFS-type drug efflux transporter P55 n=1 Tax=Aminobacter aminovorans TaxID=83263 RepID=A0A380WR39_AMIAI|nr:MFS transporter [Aminobacter aminovorans]TCS30511.1 putative MFS family arabinose efflux permease [Aminobacter aminovorans]SUU91360.1 Metal-tetracycline/H(+) antiporter [Aminobacter aminovorans]
MNALQQVRVAEAAAAPDRLAGRNVTLLLISTLTIMSGATISPSLPAIESHFAGSPDVEILTRLVLTLPALSIVICASFAGGLADRFGRRPLLIVAALLYGLGGMSGLLAESLPTLLVGRALLGIAVAGIMTTATALVGDYFSGPARDRFMGYQSAFVGFGGLIFLTGGGMLAELHWRAPFAVYGLSLLLIPAVIAFIDEPVRSRLPSSTISTRASAGTAWLAVFTVYIAAMLNSVAFYLLPTQLPFHLNAMGIGSPTLAGLAIGLSSLIGAVAALAYARLRASLGVIGVFGLAFGLMATGYILLGLANALVMVLLAAAVVGLGLGIMMPNIAAAAMAAAAPEVRGRVAGGMTASIFAGHFISPFASQPMIAAFGFANTYLYAGLAVGSIAVLGGASAILRASTDRSNRAGLKG